MKYYLIALFVTAVYLLAPKAGQSYEKQIEIYCSRCYSAIDHYDHVYCEYCLSIITETKA